MAKCIRLLNYLFLYILLFSSYHRDFSLLGLTLVDIVLFDLV